MTTEQNIALSISPENLRFFAKTADSLKNGIRMLGVHDLYKQSLIKDVHILESIVRSAKKEKLHAHEQNGKVHRNGALSVPGRDILQDGRVG